MARWAWCRKYIRQICKSTIRANGNHGLAEVNASEHLYGTGIYVRNGLNIAVRDCVLESNSTGVYFEMVRSSVLDCNYFEQNRTCAVNLKSCHGVSVRNQYGYRKESIDNAHLIVIKDSSNIDCSGCTSQSSNGITERPTIKDNGGNSNIHGIPDDTSNISF